MNPFLKYSSANLINNNNATKMKLSLGFLLFLLFTIFGGTFSNGATINGTSTRIACQNVARFASSPDGDVVLPGIERMALGIDITKLDLFPTNFHQTNGFMKPVLDFTYKNNSKWVDPSNDQVYYKPDQVNAFNPLPSGNLEAKSQVSGDSQTYKDSMDAKVGLSVDTVEYGKYSASVSYKDVQEQVFKYDGSVSEVRLMETEVGDLIIIKISLNPPIDNSYSYGI